jgi:L-threonylcarbamoyladenylate synthase
VPIPTRTISIDPDDPDPVRLEEAAVVLRRGGLVAFATETVYGLGAVATDPEAVARIYEAKGRPAINPLIVHADGIARARACVAAWPREAEELAARFWPGPLTLVLPRAPIIPDAVTAGRDTVGIRIPRPTVARALIERAGRPIAAPSANRSTGVSPTLARHVAKDLSGRIDLILDSGPTTVGLESTVLDLTTRPPRVLRPGMVGLAQLRDVIGDAVVGPEAGSPTTEPRSSPGQMAIHYAPRTPAIRVPAPWIDWFDRPGTKALLIIGPHVLRGIPPRVIHRIDLVTPEDAARRLYAALHECDESDADLIVIVPPLNLPEWQAIRDRLRRAAPAFFEVRW